MNRPIHRRHLLKAVVAGGIATSFTGCSLLPRKTGLQPERYAGAVGLPDGSFGVSAFDRSGNIQWQSQVETRCHSGCNRPGGKDILFFERRPGWSFYVFDAETGERRQHIMASEGEHFGRPWSVLPRRPMALRHRQPL